MEDLQDVNQNAVLSDATPLECQVAGHSIRKGKKSLGMLSHKDGYVLKPMLKPGEQGDREVTFYEEVHSSKDPLTRELSRFMPKYYGSTNLNIDNQNLKWIVLGNATQGFSEPCIMDVKIGKQTWDPLATEEKKKSEESKYQDCKRDVGFCIPGFQVYRLSTGELIKQDRVYGKTLNGETVKTALLTYLNADYGLSRSLVLQLLAKLWKILRWFRTQTRYRFYSSSLLLVYDAAKLKQSVRNGLISVKNGSVRPTIGRQLSLRIATGPLTPGYSEEARSRSPGSSGGSPTPATPATPSSVEDWHTLFDNVCKTHSLEHNYEKDLQSMKENYSVVLKDLVGRADHHDVWVNVNMIDFAHVYHSNSDDLDRNYLNGLQNLVNIFEQFLMEADF